MRGVSGCQRVGVTDQPSLHQVAVQRSASQWWQRDLARLAPFQVITPIDG